MVNKVILVGNVGKNPDISYTQAGSKIASFSVATSENWKDKVTGERKTQTQWHRVVIFNDNLADIAEKYVKQGSKLYIEGSLSTRKYTGNDGVEKQITEVVISKFKGELQMLDSRGSTQGSTNYSDHTFQSADKKPSQKQSNSTVSNIGDDLDDEIPF